jgi:hypothetical protein
VIETGAQWTAVQAAPGFAARRTRSDRMLKQAITREPDGFSCLFGQFGLFG